MSKYLVITGGSRGIGEATIAHFIEQGWSAINISRNPCKIANVQNFSIDLSKPENISRFSDQLRGAVSEASHICLVHNAGYQTKDTVETVTLDGINHTMNINVISSTLLNQIYIPHMKPGSSILYLGSMLADRGVPGNASYIMSKHAVLGLMRATCQDLYGKAISTACICPGLVETKLLRESMDDNMIDYLLNNYVIGKRVIQPHEIAKVIHTCALTPAMNGSLVPVNTGIIAS